jgi:hypothetical protein
MSGFVPKYTINFSSLGNANPLSDGGNWVPDASADAQLQILGNLCQTTTQNAANVSVLTGPVLTSDQYCDVTLGGLSSGSSSAFLRMYVRTTTNLLTNGSYRFLLNGLGNWALAVVSGGTLSTLTSGTGLSFSPGDVFRLAAFQTTISVFQNGSQITSTTDSTAGTGLNQSLSLQAVASFPVATVQAYTAGNIIAGYSVPDYRVTPNQSRNVQGTLIYDKQISSNPSVPSVDSRAGGAPVDSRVGGGPQNSRTPGTFGPGE